MPSAPLSTPRRAWFGIAMTGLLAVQGAQAQMGGGMGGGPGGGKGAGPDCKKSAAPAADPVGSTLVKIYAGERLRSLPDELQLAPALMPLFARR